MTMYKDTTIINGVTFTMGDDVTITFGGTITDIDKWEDGRVVLTILNKRDNSTDVIFVDNIETIVPGAPKPAEPQDGSVIAFGNYHVFSREDENASEEGNWFETGNSRGYKWNNFPYSAQKNGLADYVVLRDGFPEED